MVFPESVIIRNTGRKCVLERLKPQGSELNELAWFIFSGHARAFRGIPLSSFSVHWSPSLLVFTFTYFWLTSLVQRSLVISPHLLPGEIKASKRT